jgi:hypothetical protein
VEVAGRSLVDRIDAWYDVLACSALPLFIVLPTRLSRTCKRVAKARYVRTPEFSTG